MGAFGQVLFGLDKTILVKKGDQFAVIIRNQHINRGHLGVQQIIHQGAQGIKPFPCLRADRNGVGIGGQGITQTFGLCRVGQIDLVNLVERRDHQLIASFEFFQHLFDRTDLLIHILMGKIHDVQQHIRFGHLFERGAKGSDQHRWQLLDKTDRIGQHDLVTAGQRHTPRCWIKRGKKLIGRQYIRLT